MSSSRLESLPNEILVHIFEKYVDGIDIINAFAFQLNRRFDALIMQSRRLRLNFIKCHTDDFRLCMGLLPAYVDKIGELVLAERCTPGQIHSFLSFYPSFAMFKRLRKLYVQVDLNATDSVVFDDALQSLANVALRALSLKISTARNSYPSEKTIREIFYIKTLKKLSINGYYLQRRWNLLRKSSSNVQYLSIHDTRCKYTDLLDIFRCAPNLRYLDIDLEFYEDNEYQMLELPSMDSLPQMPMLHTAFFGINSFLCNERMINQLTVLFECMPRLHHLEIKIGSLELSIDVCKALIQTILPSLTSFVVEITLSRITNKVISSLLTLTETLFWMENEGFHLIIKDVLQSTGRRFYLQTSSVIDAARCNEVVFRWGARSSCYINDSPFVSNKICKLYLFPQSESLSQNYYLHNVTHLFIDGLDDRILTYITTHINCSHIHHLDLSSMTGNNLIFPLLECATNVRSLRINFIQLHDELYEHARIYGNIQSLDTSADRHRFNEKDIFTISRIFPHLQHLIVYTKDLQNVPILETYLPRLRSFTFSPTELSDTDLYDVRGEESFYNSLRNKAEFLFQRNGDWITVWINQAALRDSFWRKTRKTDNSKRSDGGSWVKRATNKIFSLFK